MKTAFTFEDGGRTYTCEVDEQRNGNAEEWWWFGVSGDKNRYAPFRAAEDDSEASVRARIVACYEERLKPRVFTSWRDRNAAGRKPA
jgi:hypothetical protein